MGSYLTTNRDFVLVAGRRRVLAEKRARGVVRALSIRQPWAWLIVNGFKPVENRSWWSGYVGPLLIHASKGMTAEEYEGCQALARMVADVVLPPAEELLRGGVVGMVRMTGCVRPGVELPLSEPWVNWYTGGFGFLFQEARPLPFLECKGQLGFFEIEYPGLAGVDLNEFLQGGAGSAPQSSQQQPRLGGVVSKHTDKGAEQCCPGEDFRNAERGVRNAE